MLRAADVEGNRTPFVAFSGNRDALASTCGSPPGVAGVVRQPIGCKRHHLLMPELLCCHLVVAIVTKVAGVLVFVAAAKSERLDMVDDGGKLDPVSTLAELTEASRSSHAPLTLALASPPSKALNDHEQRPEGRSRPLQRPVSGARCGTGDVIHSPCLQRCAARACRSPPPRPR